jgi:hypothetical protein
VDPRALAKLIASKVGNELTDLDKVLESLGVEMSWAEKIKLVQSIEEIEAFHHIVSGKILVRKKYQQWISKS